MKKGDSILGFITGPTVSFHFMDSVLQLYRNDVDQRFEASMLAEFGSYIHANRNQLQRDFLKTDKEWLFSVDNDMVFTPSDVWPLFHEAEKRGPGIYSGPYMLENSFLVCGAWDDEVDVAYHNIVALPSKPVEIGMVGMGFTLIHREVFEDLGENAFRGILGPDGDDAGEDVSFCWRAHKRGWTPILVPECNPGHWKTFTIYPHGSMRNVIAEEISLVKINEELKSLQLPEEVK